MPFNWEVKCTNLRDMDDVDSAGPGMLASMHTSKNRPWEIPKTASWDVLEGAISGCCQATKGPDHLRGYSLSLTLIVARALLLPERSPACAGRISRPNSSFGTSKLSRGISLNDTHVIEFKMKQFALPLIAK